MGNVKSKSSTSIPSLDQSDYSNSAQMTTNHTTNKSGKGFTGFLKGMFKK